MELASWIKAQGFSGISFPCFGGEVAVKISVKQERVRLNGCRGISKA